MDKSHNFLDVRKFSLSWVIRSKNIMAGHGNEQASDDICTSRALLQPTLALVFNNISSALFTSIQE